MIKDVDFEKSLEKVKKEKEHLTIFFSAAKEILEFTSFKVTARKLFYFCKEITGATAGYVALLTSDGKENKVLFLNSGDKDRIPDPYLSMPVNNLSEKVYNSRKALYFNDFMNSHWHKILPDGHMPVKNILYAPLVIENNAVGIIVLSNKPEDFNRYDADMAAAFGKLAASALHNSWLFDEIRKQNSGKEKLISVISHDVKNLLNSIHGFSKLLAREVESNNREKIERFAEIINMASADANQLLDDLLTWVQANSGKLIFTPAIFDLSKLIKKAVRQYKHVAQEKKINVCLDIINPARVYADKKMIFTVLRNLIGNAVKFTDQDGEIIITTMPTDNDIEISITDNGVGMTDEKVKNLFEQSEDLILSEIRNEKSSGLGLLLCKEFIEKHGKEIKVKSKPGKGSTFSFSLFLAKEVPAKTTSN